MILILVDDLGWMDLSCQGSDYYKTRAIDQIATEGMRYTNGYAACAVCSPTRAAVQTGRYPHRVGVTDWIRSLFQRGNRGTPERNPTEYVGGKNRAYLCPPNPYWMEHEEITIAEALKARGYQSGYIGKWHLGDPAWYPPGQGYDENKGGCDYGQPPSYFDPYNQPKGRHESLRKGIHNLPGRRKGEFLTHREGDEAEALIRGWHARKQPFFLQVGHYAVHTPSRPSRKSRPSTSATRNRTTRSTPPWSSPLTIPPARFSPPSRSSESTGTPSSFSPATTAASITTDLPPRTSPP